MSELRPSAGPEGEILLGIRCSAHAVADVDIGSTRPVHASRLFIGKRPEEALKLVPLLFALCGTAQVRSAVVACERALGIRVPHRVAAARQLLVHLETAREHLWRISMDWPALCEVPPNPEPVARVAALLNDLRAELCVDGDLFAMGAVLDREMRQGIRDTIERLRDLLGRELFGMSPDEFSGIRDSAGLDAWARTAGPGPALIPWVAERGWGGLIPDGVVPLTILDESELKERFGRPEADDFLARPRWRGEVRETGPYTRCLSRPLVRSLRETGDGLLARLAARLVELAEMPGVLSGLLDRLEIDGCVGEDAREADGTGLAQTEAARGRLIHYVRVSDGVIREFRVLAPTEWNFHPQGVLARALGALSDEGRERLEIKIRLVASAIDPCVGYRVQIDRPDSE